MRALRSYLCGTLYSTVLPFVGRIIHILLTLWRGIRSKQAKEGEQRAAHSTVVIPSSVRLVPSERKRSSCTRLRKPVAKAKVHGKAPWQEVFAVAAIDFTRKNELIATLWVWHTTTYKLLSKGILYYIVTSPKSTEEARLLQTDAIFSNQVSDI